MSKSTPRISAREKLEQELRYQIRLGKRMLVVGILLMLVGTYCFAQTRKYLASAVRAPGKIVEIEKQKHDKDIVNYPVFSFADSAGATHVIHTSTAQTRTFSGSNQGYKVGDAVEVLYPIGDPESARLHNHTSVWGFTEVFGGIGFLLAAVGAFLWYGALRAPVAELLAHPEQMEEPK